MRSCPTVIFHRAFKITIAGNKVYIRIQQKRVSPTSGLYNPFFFFFFFWPTDELRIIRGPLVLLHTRASHNSKIRYYTLKAPLPTVCYRLSDVTNIRCGLRSVFPSPAVNIIISSKFHWSTHLRSPYYNNVSPSGNGRLLIIYGAHSWECWIVFFFFCGKCMIYLRGTDHCVY